MVVRITKKTNRKRDLPKKTKKMRGGMNEEQKQKIINDVLRILSKLIVYGALGYITWCMAVPLITEVFNILESVGVTTLSMTFYKILWGSIYSMVQSVYNASMNAVNVGMDSAKFVAAMGNAGFIVHLVHRLGNPLYSFILTNIQRVIECIKNPKDIGLQIEGTISEATNIVTRLGQDYKTVIHYGIEGVDRTYETLNSSVTSVNNILQRMVNDINTHINQQITSTAEQRIANEKTMLFFEKLENIIYEILSFAYRPVSSGVRFVASGVRSMRSMASSVRGMTYELGVEAKAYAKSVYDYYKEYNKLQTDDLDTDLLNEQIRRTASPSPEWFTPEPGLSPEPEWFSAELLPPELNLSDTPQTDTPPDREATAAAEKIVSNIVSNINPAPIIKEMERCVGRSNSLPSFSSSNKSQFLRRPSVGVGDYRRFRSPSPGPKATVRRMSGRNKSQPQSRSRSPARRIPNLEGGNQKRKTHKRKTQRRKRRGTRKL